MGNTAKEAYITAWNMVTTEGALMTEASTTTMSKATVGSQPTSTFGPLWLILTVGLELWTLYQLMTHWQVDTLLEKFEKVGQAYTEHISKTFTFDEGTHNVWAGMQSDAEGFLFFFGFAYAAGLVKSITIDGIAPPETPVLYYPDEMRAGELIEFRPYCIDQNDDPVQYLIWWGDGTNTITEQFPSGEEGLAEHTYDNPGTYIITIKSKDCDKLESESATYDIVILSDNNEPYVNDNSNIQSSPTLNQQSILSSQQSSNPLFSGQFPNAFPILRNLLGL